MAYHRYHQLDTRILRIFNTYGPRMQINNGRLIPNFMWQALRGEKLTVYGDGSQTRCFCYVDDMIQAMIALMSYEDPNAAEPVNAGGEDERSMSAIVDCLGEIFGRKLPVELRPLPSDDPARSRSDCTRARQ